MNRLADEFDNQLKHALRRQDPPMGFAERVIAQSQKATTAAHHGAPKPQRFFFFPGPAFGGYLLWVRSAAAAAISAVLIAGGIHYRTLQVEKAGREKAQRERIEGEAAKQRLILALRIAGSKLQVAREKVQQINAPATDSQQEKE
jgi:hypothetical protein